MASYNEPGYTEAVEGHPVAEADAAWQAWLTTHPRTAQALDLGRDVIIETGRYVDDTYTGSFRRYLVKTEVIDSSET